MLIFEQCYQRTPLQKLGFFQYKETGVAWVGKFRSPKHFTSDLGSFLLLIPLVQHICENHPDCLKNALTYTVYQKKCR